MKLKERDEKHQSQLAAWKAELGPRKKVRLSTEELFIQSFVLRLCKDSCLKILQILFFLENNLLT